MRILSLDTATKTGWAFSDGDNITFGSFAIPSGMLQGREFRFFYEAVLDLIVEHKPDLVVYEMPYLGKMMNANTIQKLYGIVAILLFLCEKKRVLVKRINSTTARKFMLGRGTGKREVMKGLVMEWSKGMGFRVNNDDEADALLMLHYSRNMEAI